LLPGSREIYSGHHGLTANATTQSHNFIFQARKNAVLLPYLPCQKLTVSCDAEIRAKQDHIHRRISLTNDYGVRIDLGHMLANEEHRLSAAASAYVQ